MKIIPLSLHKEQAKKELKQFMIAGYVAVVIGLFILPSAFGLIAGAFGLRCIVLSYNKTLKHITQLRAPSYILFILGILELVTALLVKP